MSSNLVGANENKEGNVNSQIIDPIKKPDGLESEKTVVNLSQGDFDSEGDEIENPQNPQNPEEPEDEDYSLVNRVSSQNVGVKKKEDQVTAKLGDILRYTIRVTNTDYSSTSKEIIVVDNIPEGLDFIENS